MKFLMTLTIFLGLWQVSFGQNDSPSDHSKDTSSISLEEIYQDLLADVEELVNDIDLNKLLKEDLPRVLEDIKPSEEDLEKIEEEIDRRVTMMREIDLSKLDESIEELKESIEEIIKEVPEIIEKGQRKKGKI